MNLTAVVEQRLEHGRTTAAGPYIELVDLGEVDQLSDAYLSLNDRKYGPEEQPPPLTSEEFKRYVRLAHDAIRSTDEAIDAFKEEKDGTMGKTSAMNYIDGLKMFEVQLVVGKLVKAVHKVHSGTITTPSWPMITALKFHKFQTFPDRMDKVIVALRTWKSLGKALFLDMVSMEKRLAMQPGEEIKKKGLNKSNNGNRDVQLQFARSNMPKAKKPATPANNDDDDEDDADNDGTPAPAIKKRRRATADAVIINPDARRGNNRGKKKKPVTQPTAPAASVSTNPSESVQPASSAASASSKTAVSGQPSNATRTAFTPINRRPLSQPAEPSIPAPNAGSPVGEAPSTSVDMRIGDPGQDATPTALRGDGFSQPTIFACHASADQQAAMDLLLSDKQAATKGLDDKFKFPRPLGKPSPKDGNQLPVPQTAAPWPGAHQDPLPSSQWLLPSQPQQARPPCLYSYPSQPPPDYATSQRASASFWQGTPRRDNPFPQASQQNQMQATRRNAPQRPFDRQPPSHNDANEDDIQRQGTTHYGQQTTTFGSLQNEGQVTKVHFQKNGRIIHNPMVGMRQEHSGPGAVSVSGTGVVSIHNYFQRRMPGALASTSDRNDPARGNYSGWHSFQSLDDNEGTLNGNSSFWTSPQGQLSSESPTISAKVGQQDEEQQDQGQQGEGQQAQGQQAQGQRDQEEQDQRGSSTPVAHPSNHSSQATGLAAYDRPVASPTAPIIVSEMRLEDMDPDDAAAIMDCRRVALGLPPLYTVDTENADGDSEPNDEAQESSDNRTEQQENNEAESADQSRNVS